MDVSVYFEIIGVYERFQYLTLSSLQKCMMVCMFKIKSRTMPFWIFRAERVKVFVYSTDLKFYLLNGFLILENLPILHIYI